MSSSSFVEQVNI